jgi:hypothetical protein
MNRNSLLHSARKVSTCVAIAAFALTIGSGLGSSATTGHQTGVSQSTKEWKSRTAVSTTDVVLATKEWKGLQPLTKEW